MFFRVIAFQLPVLLAPAVFLLIAVTSTGKNIDFPKKASLARIKRSEVEWTSGRFPSPLFYFLANRMRSATLGETQKISLQRS